MGGLPVACSRPEHTTYGGMEMEQALHAIAGSDNAHYVNLHVVDISTITP